MKNTVLISIITVVYLISFTVESSDWFENREHFTEDLPVSKAQPSKFTGCTKHITKDI